MECKSGKEVKNKRIWERELIETLWNVNSRVFAEIGGFIGINRNIVECKLDYLSAFLLILRELIETLWNVNQRKGAFFKATDSELIETLWNVNQLV